MGSKSSDIYLYKKQKICRNKGGVHLKMEVETRDMLPQAKDHQESSETDKERGFPESLIP